MEARLNLGVPASTPVLLTTESYCSPTIKAMSNICLKNLQIGSSVWLTSVFSEGENVKVLKDLKIFKVGE